MRTARRGFGCGFLSLTYCFVVIAFIVFAITGTFPIAALLRWEAVAICLALLAGFINGLFGAEKPKSL